MTCGVRAPNRRPAGCAAARLGRRLAGAAALLACISGATACAQPAGRPDEQTLAAIDALIGSARCRDDGQCRIVGIGANPCGGPERYLAWSIVVTDADALRRLAARHAEQRQRLHEQTGMSSVCVVLPEPAVRCDRPAADAEGRCVLVRPAPAGPLVR